MKKLIITLIAGIVLSQLGISAANSSENSAVRDLAAAKSLAFGGVGVAGIVRRRAEFAGSFSAV